MTKKDFVAMADMIRKHNSFELCPLFTDRHIEALAQFCASQSPKFKSSRWKDYIAGRCGMNGGKPRS